MHYTINYLILQLALSITSLPILIAWGLAWPPISIIATALFMPIFSIFLSVCSLIFFAHLCGIPHQFLLTILSYLSTTWTAIMYNNPYTYVIPLYIPSPILLIIPPIVLVYILLAYYPHKPVACLRAITLLLCTIISFSYLTRPQNAYISIPCGNQEISVLIINNHITLIDPGAFSRLASPQSWVEYTLIPHLIQNSGRNHVDTIICLQPSLRTYKTLKHCIRTIQPACVYIPLLHPMPDQCIHAHEQCTTIAERFLCTIHTIDKTPIDLKNMHIIPTHQQLNYTRTRYPYCHVICTNTHQSTLFLPVRIPSAKKG